MNTPTSTPRTDAAIKEGEKSELPWSKLVQCARQLETELAAAQAEADKRTREVELSLGVQMKLNADLAEARDDSERLAVAVNNYRSVYSPHGGFLVAEAALAAHAKLKEETK